MFDYFFYFYSKFKNQFSPTLMENIDFNETSAYKNLKEFVVKINQSILNEKQNKCMLIERLIEEISKLNNKITLNTGPQRFGNTAFRDFYDKLKENAKKILKKININVNEDEISYLTESIGNKTRIDYGTGHEVYFLCFIYCLVKRNIINLNECYSAMDFYFDLARNILVKYNLEPAGSHGVWGIDDYQMLPFVFGSAELINYEVDFNDLLNELKNDDTSFKNLGFMKCLLFSKKQKCPGRNISFKNHSPMLYSMKSISWSQMNHELMKKFDNDVLLNRAMNQHFIFSEALSK